MAERPTPSQGPSGSPPADTVSGIVLAGGRSRRFGSDKLVAEIDGRTLLAHAVDALARVVTEIVVVVAPDDQRPLPETSVPLRRGADAASYEGPLAGVAAGLDLVREPLVVVVGGDMPSMEPDVLRLLVRVLNTDTAEVDAVVLSVDGRLVPLPAALRTRTATGAVARLIATGERRLRRLFEEVPTRTLDEPEWRPLDPAGRTLHDVDRPEDL